MKLIEKILKLDIQRFAAATVAFAPLNEATGVTTLSTVITATFSAAVRNLDDSAIADEDLAAKIDFKLTDVDGDSVPCAMTINAGKTIVTIVPTVELAPNTLYYVGILADSFENVSGEKTAATAVTWTTSPVVVPVATNVAMNSIVSKAEIACDVDGNTFTYTAADDATIIVLRNSGASARVVTVKAPVLKNYASAIADLTYSLPAGEVAIVRVETARYADINRMVNIDTAHAEVKFTIFNRI